MSNRSTHQRGRIYTRGCRRMAHAWRSTSAIRRMTSGFGIWLARHSCGSRLTQQWTAPRYGRRMVASCSARPVAEQRTSSGGRLRDPSAAERLTHSPNEQFPTSISPDGAFVVFSDNTTQDVMMLALNGDRFVRPLVQTRFVEENGEISPDGRWLAYQSNQSGQHEIYVRPFPDVASGDSQVSAGGGTRPLWARSGQELFYVGPTGSLMSVPIQPGTRWQAGSPRKVLEGGRYFFGSARITHRTYDVSPDGRRFLLIKPVGESEQNVTAERYRCAELDPRAETRRADRPTFQPSVVKTAPKERAWIVAAGSAWRRTSRRSASTSTPRCTAGRPMLSSPLASRPRRTCNFRRRPA